MSKKRKSKMAAKRADRRRREQKRREKRRKRQRKKKNKSRDKRIKTLKHSHHSSVQGEVKSILSVWLIITLVIAVDYFGVKLFM